EAQDAPRRRFLSRIPATCCALAHDSEVHSRTLLATRLNRFFDQVPSAAKAFSLLGLHPNGSPVSSVARFSQYPGFLLPPEQSTAWHRRRRPGFPAFRFPSAQS